MKAFFLRSTLRLTLLATLFLTFEMKAFAWDTSVHFYTTYALARYVGMKHEVALNLAVNAEWVDYSKFSTPMGSLVFGTHLRRLFHFVTEYHVTPGVVRAHGRIPGFLGISSAIDPLGTEMFINGILQNDIEMIGMGLHTLEDLTGHAGFSPFGGHAEYGHHPDRLHVYPDRFERMIVMVTRALVVVRDRLPPEAIDMNFRDFMIGGPGEVPNAKLSADELAKHFLNRTEVQEARQNILKDPEYVEFAIRELFSVAQKRNFILPDVRIEQVLPPIEFLNKVEPVDVVIRDWWKELFERQLKGEASYFDMQLVKETFLRGFGLVDGHIKYSELTKAEQNTLADRVFSGLLEHYIPTELGPNQWAQFEVEGPIRQKEIELVNARFQKFIKKLFGGDTLQFVHSTKEFHEKRSASVECVGKCSWFERLRFNYKMVRYLLHSWRNKSQYDFNWLWMYPAQWEKFWNELNMERITEGKNPIPRYLVTDKWLLAERAKIDKDRAQRQALNPASCSTEFKQ